MVHLTRYTINDLRVITLIVIMCLSPCASQYFVKESEPITVRALEPVLFTSVLNHYTNVKLEPKGCNRSTKMSLRLPEGNTWRIYPYKNYYELTLLENQTILVTIDPPGQKEAQMSTLPFSEIVSSACNFKIIDMTFSGVTDLRYKPEPTLTPTTTTPSPMWTTQTPEQTKETPAYVYIIIIFAVILIPSAILLLCHNKIKLCMEVDTRSVSRGVFRQHHAPNPTVPRNRLEIRERLGISNDPNAPSTMEITSPIGMSRPSAPIYDPPPPYSEPRKPSPSPPSFDQVNPLPSPPAYDQGHSSLSTSSFNQGFNSPSYTYFSQGFASPSAPSYHGQ